MPEVRRRWSPREPDFIPYSKDLPRDSTSTKGKGKGSGHGASEPGFGETTADRIQGLKVS